MGEMDTVPAASLELGAPEQQADPEDVRLLLSGEGVAFLTETHRALLAQVASEFVGGKAVRLNVAAGDIQEVFPKFVCEPLNFMGKAPDDIISMYRDVFNYNSDQDLDDVRTHMGQSWEAGFDLLCVDRPDVAADVLEVLATNAADFSERDSAAICLDSLAKTNPEAAVVLAATLLRDDDFFFGEPRTGGRWESA